MDLTRYLDSVAADLSRATALADDQTRATAERLTTVLEPALRLAMVQLLSDAGAQLTSSLHGPVVTVRMAGRDPEWHVQAGPSVEPVDPDPEPEPDAGDNSARISLRLPEQVKKAAESLADKQGQSLNTWLVQTIRRATSPSPSPTTSNRRITGWA